MLELQQRFRSKLYIVFMEKVNGIVLGGNDDERLQTFDWVTLYTYGTGPERMCESKLMRHPKIKKNNVMGNFDEVTGENKQADNPHWLRTPIVLKYLKLFLPRQKNKANQK